MMRVDFPIEIICKLSLTREQAKLMFGYDMKAGAKGVVLQRRGDSVYIRSLMPQRHINTKLWQMTKLKFKVLSKLCG
ncbi:MAG: hypothetical protein QMD71_05845 [bacterium]|nr:hypothetical protein [bacterium]